MPLDYGHAVSLRVLQERLGACMANGNCPHELLNLGGLTKIHGYVVDDANQDVILFGEVDSEVPPLQTEDFVIALRNAWLRYSTMEGNARYFSNPGCSIDPDPRVIGQLDDIKNWFRANNSGHGGDDAIQNWQQVCEQPQGVRVLGIPFNTRFAKVMIDADYYMKKLVNGSVQVGVAGFESLTDMTMKKIREDVVNNRPISVRIGGLNRFEFIPGGNTYLEDEDIVFIEKCPVTLTTEEEYLSTKGDQIGGTGQADPLAQQFADSFSVHYDEIAKKEPIYLELEGLFRFVALAKIMKEKGRTLNLDYLLERFPVPENPVASTLPGISHVKDFEHRWDYQGGSRIAQFWLPSCGGVSIGINANPENFQQQRMYELRETILQARPSLASLIWPFGKKRRNSLQIVQKGLQQGQSLDQIKSNLPNDVPIYAVEKLSDREIMVFFREDNEYKMATVYSKHINVTTGEAAITQYEEIARSNCARASNPSAIFVHASQQNNEMILQVGEKQARLPMSEIMEILNNPKSLQAATIDQVLGSSPNATFIFYRDALARGGDQTGASWRDGTPTDPLKLASALSRRFEGRVKFYLDDEFALAQDNLRRIVPIKGPDDLVVLIPQESFRVEDHGFVKNIKNILEGSGIKVVHDPTQIGAAPNVLIISGHNDEQLFAYLKDLGEKGVLKDKLIFLETCYATSNPDKLHDLIQRYGAAGFYQHTEKINPTALAKTVEQIVEITKEIKQQGKEIHPGDLLQQAVNRALQNRDQSSQSRQELEKLSRGVLQVSEVYFKSSKTQFARNIYG